MSDGHTHGYYTGDIHNQFVEEHHDPKNKARLWRVFWILLAITIAEVIIGFKAQSWGIGKTPLIWTFVILTLVKAGYIVLVFMHLGDEKKALRYTILLPFVLILYLIFIALTELIYIYNMDNFYK